MVDWQHQLGWKQLHVHVGLPGLFQHAVGIYSPVRSLVLVQRYHQRLCCPRDPDQGQEEAIMGSTIACSGVISEGICETQNDM